MRIKAFSISGRMQQRTLPPPEESDEDRDIADWDAVRRLVLIYMPLLALAPILASAVYLMAD